MAKIQIGINDLNTLSPDIAKEWHPTLNGDLQPCNVGNRSSHEVWWLCPKGHAYKKSIVNRTVKGQSCPTCRREEHSLSRVHPELLVDWDYEKNVDTQPDDVFYGSERKVWWKCSAGHSYEQAICNRSMGQGCPICANKTHVGVDANKSLAVLSPDIAKEWHPSLNGDLTPYDVHNGSSMKVWWLCDRGHDYQKTIAKRTLRGQGCPTCRLEDRSLARIHPELLEFWDYEKNTDIKPEEVFFGSEKKVWWKCSQGHSYQQRVSGKTSGMGCPICSHQQLSEENCLAVTNPEIANEWHPTKNGGLTPYDVMPSAHKKVWWLCPYGHEYQTVIYARQRTGCPICDSEKRTSFPEQAIQYYLSKLFVTESRSDVGGFEADVFCPSIKIAIEYDGEYYHFGEANDAREKRKNQFFIEQGITLFRVKETKKNIRFDCHKVEYGYEINVQYSQDYEFVEDVLSAIIDILNSQLKAEYSLDLDIRRDKVEIINQYAQIKDSNSFLIQKPLGAKKWDYEKNGDIDLRLLPKTSKKKYWWKCPTCGNEWYGSLDCIVNSLTCNKCSRQVKSEYDVAPEIMMDSSAVFRELPINLQTENPDLANQWHPTKNGFFKPIHVSPKSGKRVWWLCPICGNEWTQMVKTRNNGKTARMCPVCANNQPKKANDSIVSFSELLYKEWHPTKNGSKTLNDYTPGSNAVAWWICSKCGLEYTCTIKHRSNGGGCTSCGRAKANAAKHKKVRNMDTGEVFESVKSAAASCGVIGQAISTCLSGRSKTAGGFHWEYYTDEE